MRPLQLAALLASAATATAADSHQPVPAPAAAAPAATSSGSAANPGSATKAGPAAKPDSTAHPGPAATAESAEPVPVELRAILAAADRAEADKDLATAYARLRDARNLPQCTAELGVRLDTRRDALAQRLGDELIAQAAVQEREQHPEFAEKLYLQALTYRSRAAADLVRFYARPDVAQALGAEEIAAQRHRLDGDEQSAAALRWNLARWSEAAAAGWADLDRQLARIDRLIALAGAADREVVTWTRHARALGLALARANTASDGHDAAAWTHLTALSARMLGDDAARDLRSDPESVRRHDRLAALGASESALTLRVAAIHTALSGSFTSTTVPAGGSGFATRSASASPSGSSTGLRWDLGWLHEPGPVSSGPDLVYGISLAGLSTTMTSSLAVSDPDTGAASLNGQGYSSNLSLGTIGFNLVAGARWALDDAWSLQARGFAGWHHARLNYGSRRGALDGHDSDETVQMNGSMLEAGVEAEAAWRFVTTWALVGDLGLDYARLKFGRSTETGTFTNSAGTQQSFGTTAESFSGLHLIAPYLGVGLRATF